MRCLPGAAAPGASWTGAGSRDETGVLGARKDARHGREGRSARGGAGHPWMPPARASPRVRRAIASMAAWHSNSNHAPKANSTRRSSPTRRVRAGVSTATTGGAAGAVTSEARWWSSTASSDGRSSSSAGRALPSPRSDTRPAPERAGAESGPGQDTSAVTRARGGRDAAAGGRHGQVHPPFREMEKPGLARPGFGVWWAV